jgi:hypothetical protein
MGIYFQSSTGGYPVFSTPFVEDYLFSNIGFVIFVKNQMNIAVWAYF